MRGVKYLLARWGKPRGRRGREGPENLENRILETDRRSRMVIDTQVDDLWIFRVDTLDNLPESDSGGREAADISTESLILAQDERWRRA